MQPGVAPWRVRSNRANDQQRAKTLVDDSMQQPPTWAHRDHPRRPRERRMARLRIGRSDDRDALRIWCGWDKAYGHGGYEWA